MYTSFQHQTTTAMESPRVGNLEGFNFSDPRYLETVRLLLQWAHPEKSPTPERIEEPEEVDKITSVVRAKIRLRVKQQRNAKR
jgi:hypothetical protein